MLGACTDICVHIFLIVEIFLIDMLVKSNL